MRLIILTIIFHLSTLIAFGQDGSKANIKYKPKNLDEAVLQLEKIHDDTTEKHIIAMTEKQFIAHSHFGIGMSIRNNWGLWKGGELSKYFNSIGIYHPDDMSGIILTSYFRHLKGQDRELEKQVKHYQDYWKASAEHFYRLKIDASYKRQLQQTQDSLEAVRLKEKKIEWSTGKVISGYLAYQCRLINFGDRTKVKGTILEWKGDKVVIQITQYFDEKKKKKVIKCNNIKNDIAMIDNYETFRLEE
jgi:hypothetical protein